MIAWYYLPIALAAVNIFWIIFIIMKQRAYNRIIDSAGEKVSSMIKNLREERLFEEKEGSLYRLFHEINSLASILNALVDEGSVRFVLF